MGTCACISYKLLLATTRWHYSVIFLEIQGVLMEIILKKDENKSDTHGSVLTGQL